MISIPTPIAIVGMGLSGKSAYRLLLNLQIKPEMIASFDEKSLGCDFQNSSELLTKFQPKTLVVSPGVALSTPWIQDFQKSGGNITSELAIAIDCLTSEKIIAITGSIGKSTTTSLLAAGAPAEDPHFFVGGNLGYPLADYVSDVFEKDLSKLRPNQTIHFTITNNAGKEYDADIFSIGTAFEPGSKTIQVHSKVIGDKTGLIDGMNVTALVSLDKSTVPAVPTDAIVSYQGNDYIFVVTDTHGLTADSTKEAVANHQGEEGVSEVVFEKIQVAKGTTDIGYSEITLLKEIPAGAKIVIKGAFFILAKMTNSGEHEH